MYKFYQFNDNNICILTDSRNYSTGLSPVKTDFELLEPYFFGPEFSSYFIEPLDLSMFPVSFSSPSYLCFFLSLSSLSSEQLLYLIYNIKEKSFLYNLLKTAGL